MTQAHDIIDTDVHEMLVSVRDLIPYLEQPWRRYVKDYGWQMERQFPYSYLSPGGLDRLDAKPPSGIGGSDLDLLRTQLFDEMGITKAVLTGLFYPATMRACFEFAAALASAYNDWEVEHWLDRDERLYGSIHISGESEAAVREIERMAKHPRMVEVLLPISDHVRWGDPQYHPIFEAAQRHNLVIAVHQSPATIPSLGFPRYYIEWHTLIPQTWMSVIVNIIFNGVFDKYPDLKVVLVEGGWSWVPHLLWRMDQQYKELRTEVPWVKRFPSDHFREHVRLSTQPTEDLPASEFMTVIRQMGSDKLLMFSTDYPHWDADTPDRGLPLGIPEALRQRILWENANATYPRFRSLSPTAPR